VSLALLIDGLEGGRRAASPVNVVEHVMDGVRDIGPLPAPRRRPALRGLGGAAAALATAAAVILVGLLRNPSASLEAVLGGLDRTGGFLLACFQGAIDLFLFLAHPLLRLLETLGTATGALSHLSPVLVAALLVSASLALLTLFASPRLRPVAAQGVVR
jgi:hypothetical protein